MPSIDAQALQAYDVKRWTLIPLHRPQDVSVIWRKGKKIERKDGKRPLDNSWTTANYNSAKVLTRCLAQQRNVGVRLKATQLVIDVDPRNGGTEGYRDLCRDLKIDPAIFPRVITGSGGYHDYMSKPADVLVLDTLKDYPGVEFKSIGRQVVAAGSIHPDTLKHYEWDALASVTLANLPPAPRKLLTAINRPERTNAVAGGGELTQEQLALKLAKLDPTEFAEHDEWLRLMMACHHSTNGDGRHEFIEWSVSDPAYADDAEVIGRRWDSLHEDKENAVTVGTLNHFLREHGAANDQVRNPDAADDFADDIEEDVEADEASEDDSDPFALETDKPAKKKKPKAKDDDGDDEAAMEDNEKLLELNAKYTWVVENGVPRIIYKDFDPVMERDVWERMSPQNFTLHYSNHALERTKPKGKTGPSTIKLGTAWIEWPRRKAVSRVVFTPGRTLPNTLNLWTGYAIKESARGNGTWNHLREMIFEILANGDDEIDSYILNWIAHMLQHPASAAEVAVVFRGGRGVGKGTLGNALAKGIGRHAISIASAQLITGRFNAHLQDVIFLFADEALKPYDKEAESRLKALITEPVLTIEGKGRDAFSAPNLLHVMMASNESWVIPAGMDERRFLVSNANTKWQGQEHRWTKLREELYGNDNAGLKRFFWDMIQERDLEGFHPRRVPTTDALIDQKIRSQGPLHSYWFNMLSEGFLPFETIKGDWETTPVRFFQESFRDDFGAWCDHSRINPNGNGRGNSRFLLQELVQLFPDSKTDLRDPVGEASTVRASPSDGRAASIEIPSLPKCREAFEAALRGKVKWPGADEFG